MIIGMLATEVVVLPRTKSFLSPGSLNHDPASVCKPSTLIHEPSGSADKTLKVWKIKNGRCIGTLVGHESSVDCCKVIKEGVL